MPKRQRVSIKRIVFRIILVSILAVSVYAYSTREAGKKVVNLDDQTAKALVVLKSDITDLQLRVDKIDKLNFEYDARVNVLSNRVRELEKPKPVEKKHGWLF